MAGSTFDAKPRGRIIEHTEPVVTRWDANPPDQGERPVGTLSVAPSFDGVKVGNGDRDVAVPTAIQDELAALAREDHHDDPVTLTAAANSA